MTTASGNGRGYTPHDDDGRFTTKLTPELIETVAERLVSGMPPEQLAPMLGFSPRTHWNWMREGKRDDGDPLCRQYAEAVDRAVATWATTMMAAATKAAHDDGRVAIDLLERRGVLPGRRNRTEVANADGQPFLVGGIDLTKLTDERLQQLRQIIEEAGNDQLDPANNVIDMAERRALPPTP